jgi:hypothetical protein
MEESEKIHQEYFDKVAAKLGIQEDVYEKSTEKYQSL